MAIRLAIVNDYEVVVRGVAEMLESASEDIEILELDASVPVSRPVDIALYDTFAQTQGDSPEVEKLLDNPEVDKVVVYTWNDDPALVEQSMAKGVAAYLSKTLTAEELVAALRKVSEGERVVCTELGPREGSGNAGDWPGRQEGLSAREAEVVALITQGLSNADIADRTCLSINSVKTYIRSSYRKMGVASRTQAVLWGLEHGFSPDRVRVHTSRDPRG